MKNLNSNVNLKSLFIVTIIFATACGSAPISSQNNPTPTIIETVSSPTSHPPTSEPMDTDINPSPTTAQPTEQIITEPGSDNTNLTETNTMNIQIGDNLLSATLVDNSSVDALKKLLSEGLITINMRDYGSMEKVGSLGVELPRNDEGITTEAGDIILFQGNMFVIYYAPNSWNFTRLGKINNVTPEELRNILGEGNVTITISLPQE